MQDANIRPALEEMYLTKTLQRFEKMKKDERFLAFFESPITVNGKKYQPLEKIIVALETAIPEMLYDVDTFNIIHGDLCFANIMVDSNFSFIKVIDPRGKFGTYDIYGDFRYELAKLFHSVDGKYDFIIKRNITILTGDSGSGKTVLIDLIRDYRRFGADSGVRVSCDCPCRTIDNEDWERQIEEITGSIIFIDEGNRFLVSKKFAGIVQNSDNYFVLATREKLPALPYSVNEIYGFRKSGKFHDAKQKYNEIYHLCG